MLGEDERQQAILLSPMRYLQLISFCIFRYDLPKDLSFSNAAGFVQFSPIPVQGSIYYGVSQNAVLMNSNLYYGCFATFGAFGLYPFIKRMDVCIIIGSWMNMCGKFIYYFQVDGLST